MLPFYVRKFRKATHVRRFTICDAPSLGWEIREEEDATVVRAVHLTDWHRVERARLAFVEQARSLCDSGWVEC